MKNHESMTSLCYDAEANMDHYRANWETAKAKAIEEGLKIIDHGWEQHVVIDEPRGTIYRYPRHETAAMKLIDEVAVLGSLESLDWRGIQIPKIMDHNERFTAYRYIPGDVLSHHTLAHLHQEDCDRIGGQLGQALAIVHSSPKTPVEQKKTKQTTTLLAYYQNRIDGSYSNHYEPAKAALDALLKKLEQPEPEVVVHGDLHGLNIVIDPNKKVLQGIIDFTEVEIGGPHQDFRKVFMADSRLLNSATMAYARETGIDLDDETVRLWAYVNEWSNLCHFANQPGNGTYQRARQHLARWGQIS